MRDLKYAVRVLRKSPLFAASAILTLGLCIGANAAIFTVVDHVLLRPLPYPAPDHLAAIATHFDRGGASDDQTGQTGSTWLSLHQSATFIDVAATSGESMGVNMVAGGHPEYIKQQRVSAGFFRVLGIAPFMGREISEDEDRVSGPAVAVLSHSLWTRAFNADPSVIGRSMILRGEPYTIVGVMPASFRSNAEVDVWTPLRPSPRGEGAGQNYLLIARLRPGVSWGDADGQVASVGAPIMKDLYRNPNVAARLHVIPLQRGLTDDLRQPLMILWGAVAMVLLIGCVNIAGLLLARSAARAPEIAMRLALGGGRAVIVRQLLVESLVLAACGGAAGIAIGYAGSQLLATLFRNAFDVSAPVGLDARVVMLTGAASIVTSVAFGLFPALQASRVNLRETLVESGGTAVAGPANRWPRRVMVVAEVALGVVLLVGAGLLIRTFDHLMRLRPGFDATHVVAATLSLQDARYTTAVRVNDLFDKTLERVRAVPGIQDAAVCLTLPFERALNEGGRWVGAKAGAERIELMNVTYVTGRYFETLRIPLVRGRFIADTDTAVAAPALVVNQAFARRYSRDADPIGRQIDMGGGTVRTIVGVVGDIQQKAGWGNFGPVAAMPASYLPASQANDAFFTLVHTWFSPSWVVRTAGPQEGMAAAMQRAVQSVDPQLPFAKFRTIDTVRGEAVAMQRVQAQLLTVLAALALILAAVGIYGLVANSVAERTRELGIRIALGATPSQTLRVAALPGIVFGGVGVVIGVALARIASRVMTHLVWGVSVGDPTTFAVAGGTVLAVALVAAVVPALRIVRLNSIRALRM